MSLHEIVFYITLLYKFATYTRILKFSGQVLSTNPRVILLSPKSYTMLYISNDYLLRGYARSNKIIRLLSALKFLETQTIGS